MMTTTTLAVFGLKGAAILGLGGLVAFGLRRGPAALRHLVWSAALVAAALLPAAQAVAPRWEVAVAPPPEPRTTSVPAVETRTAGPRSSGPAVSRASVSQERWDVSAKAPAVQEVSRTEAASEATSAPASGRTGSLDGSRAPIRRVGDPEAPEGVSARPAVPWRAILGVVWALGAVALLVGAGASQILAWRITTRGVRPPAPEVSAAVDRWARALGIDRPVRVGVHSALAVPATWGFSSPVILLPEGHRRWSPETLGHVLLHELAHVRRRDCAWQLAGEVARAIHWLNPLAWLALRLQRAESERACDDRVLALGSRASSYALDLVRLAGAVPRVSLPAAAVAMARGGKLGGRVRAILDPMRRRGPVGRAALVAVTAGAAAVALSIGGLTPVARGQEVPKPPRPPAPVSVPARPAGPVRAIVPTPPTAVEVPEALPAPAAVPVAPMPEPTLVVPGVAPVPRTAPALPVPVAAVPPVLPEPPAPDGSVLPARWPDPTTQERCVFREGGHRSSHVSIDDDHTSIRWEVDDCRMDIEMRGEVVFAADDSGIERMDRDATFDIEERVGRSSRRARFEGGRNGIERTFWVDGREQAWGPEADAWMRQILPELFRRTTLNAEARTRRFLSEGGPERVLDEIERMDSDYVARTYIDNLLDLARLDEAQTTRLLQVAVRQLESDYHMASVLIRVAQTQGLAPAYRGLVLDGARTLESDYHRRSVLDALLDTPGLTQAQFDDIVDAASTIDSDYHLASILSRVVRDGMLSDRGRAAFVRALGSIESDYQKRTVLEAFLEQGELSSDEVGRVLEYASTLDSDTHRAAILQIIAEQYELTGPEVDAFLASTREIESDHHKRQTAEVIVRRASFDAAQLSAVLEITDDISSDTHKAALLQAVIGRRAFTPDEVSRTVQSIDRVGSDHQRSETLRGMIRDQRLGDGGMLAVIASARRIGSERERSSVLLALVDRFELGDRVRDAYRAAAEEIGSSRIRDQVLARLAG